MTLPTRRSVLRDYRRRLDSLAWSRPRAALTVVVIAGFLLSRLVFTAVGLRLDDSTIFSNGTWQLLAIDQLHHHLLNSIWNLNSQPPLFNLATGLILKLPHVAISPALYVFAWGMGAALSVTTLHLCLELGLNRPLALLLTFVAMLEPANLLYQNWYFYSYPTALLLTFAVLASIRYLKSGKAIWGAAFIGACAGAVLLNSTFQWVWLLGAAGIVAWPRRREWRRVVAVFSAPLLVVCFWYVKNTVLFGTSTTSGWMGMNMARITTMTGPKDEIRSLIAQHRLSPLAGLVAFQPLAYYPPEYWAGPPTGVKVLDAPTKPGGQPNFNNPAYIRLSDHWLSDDLKYVELDPAHYASNVKSALHVFFVPADQYQFLTPNAGRISGYARIFHLVVDWQPSTTHIATINTDIGNGAIPAPSRLAWAAILSFGLVLVGVPVIGWRNRRSPALLSPLLFVWFSMIYVTAVTSLSELGENERFRYDLGPLPLVAAAVVVVAALGTLRGRGSRPSGTRQVLQGEYGNMADYPGSSGRSC